MIFTDEYTIIDLEFLVHAIRLDPCDHPEHEGEANTWRIGVVMHIGAGQPYVSAITYPSAGHRDAAFEELTRLMRAVAASRARLYAEEAAMRDEDADDSEH